MLDKDQVYRKARYAAVKFARNKWGVDNVEAITLNMVTAWEEPNGYSRWEISLSAQSGSASEFVEVQNKDFSVELLVSQTPPAETEEDEVEFEFMSARTEVIRRYKVTNAKPMVGGTIKPASVKLTFVDDDLLNVQVYGYAIFGDGSLGKKIHEVPGVSSYNDGTWPEWLRKFCARASVHGLAGVNFHRV